jgi:hypothetical protein
MTLFSKRHGANMVAEPAGDVGPGEECHATTYQSLSAIGAAEWPAASGVWNPALLELEGDTVIGIEEQSLTWSGGPESAWP